MFCISQGFKGLDICRKIAAITTGDQKAGVDDITSFFGLYFFATMLEYHHFQSYE
jgi:hypothetical protein